MERLTYMNDTCCEIHGAGNRTCAEVCERAEPGCAECPINAAFLRLKEYEDTGLTPVEVFRIKTDYSRSLSLAKEAHKLLLAKAAAMCLFCSGRDSVGS